MQALQFVWRPAVIIIIIIKMCIFIPQRNILR